MNAFKITIVSLLLTVLAACGAGGGASTAPTPGGGAASFGIHVDTGAGGTDLLSARLVGVFLESANGTGTTNLLPAAADVVLVHPSGESSGIALRRVPPGAYVTLHIVVEGGTALARRADGTSEPVALPRADLRVPIAGAFSPGAPGALLVEHTAAPNLVTGPAGGLSWSPALSARQTENVTVTGSSARVVTVDAVGRRITAQLPSFQNLAFELEIDDQSRLVGNDGSGRGVDDFLRECSEGSELSFDSFRQGDRSLRCRSVHHRGRGQGEDGYVGRIASVDVNTRTFELEVQARKVRGSYGPAPFAQLTVDAGSAVIYTSHRSTRVAAGFGDLAPGTFVEVEGSVPSNGVMIAREVEIEDTQSGGGGGGGGGARGEVEGRVSAVDPAAGTLEIAPRGNDPLIVGGASVSSATVTTDGATAIYRRESSGLRPITLADVTTADRIWILGSVSGPRSVHASWIRVELDR